MEAPIAESSEAGLTGLVERLWDGRVGVPGRLLAALLTPAELAFRGAVSLRGAAYAAGVFRTKAPPVPAVSVGNLTVGGTGKTPLVRWLVQRLLEAGAAPGILHGGYAEDEPALLRQWFPTLPVVADRNRIRGARQAVESGAKVLVLDDAFQHRRIGRDADLVLLSAEQLGRPTRMLPRGPYREPPGALRRADVVVVTRRTAPADATLEAAEEVASRFEIPVAVVHLHAGDWLTADGSPREGTPAGDALAVAGVGRPQAFYRQARGSGARVEETLTFRDHHDYDRGDAARIARRADGGPVVTTAKDAVKLRLLDTELDLWVLEQAVTFEAGEAAVLDALHGIMP